MEYYAVMLYEFVVYPFINFDLGHSHMVLLNEKSKRNVYVIILRVKTNDNNNTLCTHTCIFMAMKKGVEKGVERAMNIRFSLFHR